MSNHFKTVGDVDIFLTEGGRFTAKIGGKKVTRASLAALERLIGQRSDGLPVILTGDYSWVRQAEKDEVVDFNKRSGKARLKSGELLDSFRSIYAYDEECYQELTALLKERDEWEQRWQDILSKMQRVRGRNFEDIKNAAKEQAEQS